MKCNKGNLQNISASSISAVITVITIIILIAVFSNVDSNVKSNLESSTSALPVANNFSDNTFSGFQSLAILPTIIFAALLLGALGLLYVVFKR